MLTIWKFLYEMDLRSVYFLSYLAADPSAQGMRHSVLATVPHPLTQRLLHEQ
jgi:hypothetical protein